ncbi:histidine kinase N-terminal 7TM domain-containing protein, partial [Chloroflexota bacterium]
MRDILSDPIYLYAPLLVTLCSLILAAIVFRWGQKDVSSHLFTALLLSLTLWASLLYGMRSSQDLYTALLWERAIPASTFLTFALFYHFSVAYTRITFSSRQRITLLLSYIFFITVIAFSPTDSIIESMRLEDYGYAPNTGLFAKVIFLVYVLLIFGGAYNFIKRYRSTTSYEERNRLIYLVTGTVCVYLGIFLDAFSNLPPLALWTNLVFALVCSIAISRYHLLDIKIVARTSLVYLITSFIIAIPYLLILLLIHSFLQDFEVWWINILVILIAAATLRPLYTWAQHFVDKLFYRQRYDYLIALENFVQETHDISDLNKLISSIITNIQPVMQSSSIHLLLLSESTGDFLENPLDLPG